MAKERLSRATLDLVDPAARPPVDPGELTVGIVHLGLGAFARAHGLVFTQDAVAASGDLSWGYCGVTQRSRAVLDQLAPQDGLYSVLVRDGDSARPQVVASARELLFATGEPDRLTSRLAAPDTRVVTLTVTEKGYRHDPATRRLNVGDPDVIADAAGRAPVTVVGQLVRGLTARRSADAGPITLLSCDNLSGNGELLRSVVEDYASLLPDGAGLASWIAGQVAFPSSMVDRITPATTAQDLADTAALLGLVDEGVVVTEPFSQWVIEDTFSAGRPAWELAGATLTTDVAPYEAIKLRLLNGSHSALAYLGLLAGHEYVADAVADPAIAGAVRRLMDDVTPTLVVPDGFDVAAYQAQLRSRWENAAIRHRLAQIAMDGSQKLPNRLFGPIRERLAAGGSPDGAVLGVAAWMRYVSADVADDGSPLTLDDPMADRLRSALAGASTPAAVVAGLLSLTEVFGELSENAEFRRLAAGHLEVLTRYGAIAAARAVARS
jgi:fructuronate reductase